MSNIYKKGADYERKIVKTLKLQGYVSFRSAGSHSEFDVFALHPQKKEILLIQAKKGDSYTDTYRVKLQDELKKYDGKYEVRAMVL